MEKRKFIQLKKEEYAIKEYIKRDLGKGKISKLDIEYTPVGEKIIVATSRPGLVIGRKGEKIEELTRVLKSRFKLENPHIEIKEIENPLFDAQLVADEIAMALERMGNLKFKVIAYRKLQEIIKAGALGCELRLTGKLPSERAKSWRFAEGYLKKAGEPKKEVDRAQATALTKTGIIGIKVAIMPPTAKIYDQIDLNDALRKIINTDPDEIASSEITSPSKEEGKKSVKKTPIKSSKTKVASKKSTKEEKPVEEDKTSSETTSLDANPSSADDKSMNSDKQSLVKEEVKELKQTIETKPHEAEKNAMKIEEEIEDGIPSSEITSPSEEGSKNSDEDINRMETKVSLTSHPSLEKDKKSKVDKDKKPKEIKE